MSAADHAPVMECQVCSPEARRGPGRFPYTDSGVLDILGHMVRDHDLPVRTAVSMVADVMERSFRDPLRDSD
jgi:hypothetical protein